MRDPGFWWKQPGVLARLLWPFAKVYGAIAASRMDRAGKRIGIPVICVGNFTLGGTGKTPTALLIARLLATDGETPFFLTRGYGGQLAGPIRVDPETHSADDVGDEPLLLAREAPCIVARDRAAAAALAEASGASVIVMDDGLQNPALAKDLSIAVVDARRGFGDACVFPAGPLRAPLLRQCAHVQAILMIGEGIGASQAAELAGARQIKLLRGRLEPSADAITAIAGRRLLAFAGIGDPEKFFSTLTASGNKPAVAESFPDHHPYSEEDAARLLSRCASDDLTPVTTEKDLARLAGAEGARRKLAETAIAIPVTLMVEDMDCLRAMLRETLARRSG